MADMFRFTGILWLMLPAAPVAAGEQYFTVRVVDEQTGRGVPLVELRTVNNIRLYTDSGGIVAFHEPGLMDRRVFFHVQSHGYQFPRDAFGFRGKALHTKPGGRATLRIRRINLAERLYRVTGAGIYRDSVLVDERVPIREPLLNGQVLGSDSVMSAIYRGRIYWFWGDTNRPGYPLGNFHVPGATSQRPGAGGLDPEQGINLAYFLDERGFARETARMPGQGPTWIGGLLTLTDGEGRQRMFAGYAKIKPPLKVYERGLVEWNDQRHEFEQVVKFPSDAPLFPHGHTFQRDSDGKDYVYFAAPFPLVRVRATPEDLRDASSYEAFTCLKPGSRLDAPAIDQDQQGRVRYAWKKNTPAVGPQKQREMVRGGHLERHEGLLHLRDVESGEPVLAHRGSVYWNDYRRRWVMVTVQSGGTSRLGEVWYAEADRPLGPWAYAVKVVTHDRYSFYNPKHHPVFDQEDGRAIFFEGTYTNTFSGNPHPTPRYNYNQIMYRLDLTDPRTALPVAFTAPAGEAPSRLSSSAAEGDSVAWERIDFFALDRPGTGTIPIYLDTKDSPRLHVERENGQESAVAFHALSAAQRAPPAAVVPLWEYHNRGTGEFVYSTDPRWSRTGLVRNESPLCYVWPNPARVERSGTGGGD